MNEMSRSRLERLTSDEDEIWNLREEGGGCDSELAANDMKNEEFNNGFRWQWQDSEGTFGNWEGTSLARTLFLPHPF